MNKMLPISILEKGDVRYNDKIDYVEGDDIYKPEDFKREIILESQKDEYINEYIDNYLIDNCPPMSTHEIEYKQGNIDDYMSILEIKEIVISKKIINDIENIVWISSKRYKNVRYNGYTDTIIIPSIYKEDIENGYEFSVTIEIYNSDKSKKNHQFLKKCKLINRITPNLEYIPNKIVYKTFDKEYYGLIDEDIYVLFKNIPISMLKNVNTFFYDAAINVDTKEFLFEDSNMTKFNVHCYDISKYGLKLPLPIRLHDDNTLIPINSTPELIISKILNIPYIPVCIVDSYHTLPTIYNYKNIKTDINEIKEFLYPHIILEEDVNA